MCCLLRIHLHIDDGPSFRTLCELGAQTDIRPSTSNENTAAACFALLRSSYRTFVDNNNSGKRKRFPEFLLSTHCFLSVNRLLRTSCSRNRDIRNSQSTSYSFVPHIRRSSNRNSRKHKCFRELLFDSLFTLTSFPCRGFLRAWPVRAL